MPKRENPFGWSFADDVLQPKEVDDIEAKKAVALIYDQERAPILVAKGQGAFAEEIIEVAKAAGVHLAEDPVLAETLSYLQLQQEIPEEVYVAVATVLSWVYWLKGQTPQVLTDRQGPA
ncbi:MAG: EscU/YscU/HrcU family type III secretion system export apparatus switch protein [Pseudomonadota bacterium]|nr:EscU/YscU/HrcU family type III secretion system export apparatus switch protein [Pseudomonadota bacterium]